MRMIALLSGGLDSAVAAAKVRDGNEVHALAVDYGQRHRCELDAARAVAEALGLASFREVKVALPWGGASLIDPAVAVAKDRSRDERGAGLAPDYVPGRNTIFLALALSWADAIGAKHLVVGWNAEDQAGFPDCRADFARAFDKVAAHGTPTAPTTAAPLRAHGWRLLLTPFHGGRPEGFRYCLDNGAWHAHQQDKAFDEGAFLALLDRYEADADFVIAPDVVAGGNWSFRFSLGWIEQLLDRPIRRILFAAQDGMAPDDLRPHLSDRVGFAVGGSTEWKVATLCDPAWAALAEEFYCHVLRVNGRRRIRICQMFGADSFDGTSASMYSVNAGKLSAARRQGVLWNAKDAGPDNDED